VGKHLLMRTAATLLMLTLLAGCEKPKDWVPVYHPEHFAHWSDRMKERFPELQTVFGPSCLWGGAFSTVDACFAMEEPRRWEGLWASGWEWSEFCPAPARGCPVGGDRDIWLEFPEEAFKGRYSEEGVYRVEFVGRRTKYPGYFGHLGQYSYSMVVDRVISIKKIPGETYKKTF